MTLRKPFGSEWESWVDRLVREAEQRGEFDDLPGQGKPIPGVGTGYDENWWLKGLLQREGLAVLPDSLQLDLEIEKELTRIAQLPTERLAAAALDALNTRIEFEVARVTSGPSSTATVIDVDRFLRNWRAARTASPDQS